MCDTRKTTTNTNCFFFLCFISFFEIYHIDKNNRVPVNCAASGQSLNRLTMFNGTPSRRHLDNIYFLQPKCFADMLEF